MTRPPPRRVPRSALVASCSARSVVGAARCPERRRDRAPLDGVIFRPEVAKTPAQRSRGLMYRTAGAEGRDALRLPDATTGGFWMKNTLVPLTIVFFDSAGKRVRKLSMTRAARIRARSTTRAGIASRSSCAPRTRGGARRLGPLAALGRLVAPRADQPAARPRLVARSLLVVPAAAAQQRSSSSIPATTCARTARPSRSGPARRRGRSRTAAGRAAS